MARRIVVVHGPAMKSWLQLRMALDEDLGIAMGIEWVYLKEAFSLLLGGSSKLIPSFLEVALGIEKELVSLIAKGEETLIRYLKVSTDSFSAKARRRLLEIFSRDFGMQLRGLKRLSLLNLPGSPLPSLSKCLLFTCPMFQKNSQVPKKVSLSLFFALAQG